MKQALQAVAVALAVSAIASSQPAAAPKIEFDAVAIKTSGPQSGHFRSPASINGGPGTSDPALFRCTNCNVAFLITRAFELQRYQFPGQPSLPDTAFEMTASVPEGATPAQFVVMLQNLLKDRFHLTFHYETRSLQGYELVVAKNGPKLTESRPKPASPSAGGAARDWHGAANAGAHDHSGPGLMVFGGRGIFRGDNQTTADLARMISDQLARPVDDHTGLKGKYDIVLTWSGDASHATAHPGGTWDHGDRPGTPPGAAGLANDNASGPTLIGALQEQLGLKLEKQKAATAKVFIVDHIDRSPTEN